MMIGFRFLTIHGAAHFFSHVDVDNGNNVDNGNTLCYNVDTVIIPRYRAGCNGRKACHKGYSKVERWLLPREGWKDGHESSRRFGTDIPKRKRKERTEEQEG